MTTENPAMMALKAFNKFISGVQHKICVTESDAEMFALYCHAETIRTSLLQSAKVNVLLETLQKISRMKTMPDHTSNTFTLSMAHKLADDAISQFHATEGKL